MILLTVRPKLNEDSSFGSPIRSSRSFEDSNIFCVENRGDNFWIPKPQAEAARAHTDEQPNTRELLNPADWIKTTGVRAAFIWNPLVIFYNAYIIYCSIWLNWVFALWASKDTDGFTSNTSVTCERAAVYTSQRKFSFLFSWVRLSSPAAHCWCEVSGAACWGWCCCSGVGGGCSVAGQLLDLPWGRRAVEGDPAQRESVIKPAVMWNVCLESVTCIFINVPYDNLIYL